MAREPVSWPISLSQNGVRSRMKSVGLVWFLTSHLLGNVTLVSFGAEWGTLLAQNHSKDGGNWVKHLGEFKGPAAAPGIRGSL